MTQQTGRVLYVQYTNPGALPPIEHSAHLLADAGFEVVFLGTCQADDPLAIAEHQNIRVLSWPFQPPGWRQKIHYASFALWVIWWVFRWQPDWIYASDPLSCPAVLAAKKLTTTRIVYHEHDAPDQAGESRFRERILRARRELAARAELCVVPNDRRAEEFRQSVGGRDVLTIWNTPARGEVTQRSTAASNGTLRLVYHGSIVPARLPAAVLHALVKLPAVTLDVIGYETVGHPAYINHLREVAATCGIADRVTFRDPVPRAELMRRAAGEVGLALLPLESQDANEQAMVGASNKPFDYMAAGLALLVPDTASWRTTYVNQGFGIACDPQSADSIAQALSWFLSHPEERAAMGESGRQKILNEWNYERMFAPVLRRMTAPRT